MPTTTERASTNGHGSYNRPSQPVAEIESGGPVQDMRRQRRRRRPPDYATSLTGSPPDRERGRRDDDRFTASSTYEGIEGNPTVPSGTSAIDFAPRSAQQSTRDALPSTPRNPSPEEVPQVNGFQTHQVHGPIVIDTIVRPRVTGERNPSAARTARHHRPLARGGHLCSDALLHSRREITPPSSRQTCVSSPYEAFKFSPDRDPGPVVESRSERRAQIDATRGPGGARDIHRNIGPDGPAEKDVKSGTGQEINTLARSSKNDPADNSLARGSGDRAEGLERDVAAEIADRTRRLPKMCRALIGDEVAVGPGVRERKCRQIIRTGKDGATSDDDEKDVVNDLSLEVVNLYGRARYVPAMHSVFEV